MVSKEEVGRNENISADQILLGNCLMSGKGAGLSQRTFYLLSFSLGGTKMTSRISFHSVGCTFHVLCGCHRMPCNYSTARRLFLKTFNNCRSFLLWQLLLSWVNNVSGEENSYLKTGRSSKLGENVQLIPGKWSHQGKARLDRAQLTLPVGLEGKKPKPIP